MNKTNIAYLLLGVLIFVSGIKSAQESWSIEKETLNRVASVDLPVSFNGSGGNITMHTETAGATYPGEKETLKQVASVGLRASSFNGIGGNIATETAGATNAGAIKDFEHLPRVAIVTKIHGNMYMNLMKQCMCLLHAAYNRRVLYDIIVFTTLPLTDSEVNELQQIVHPASLKVYSDEQTLQEQIADLTPAKQKHLVDRCIDANTTEDLTWGHRCKDGKFKMPLAYTWMSEFRSKQIWTNKALEPYKYMLWFDADSFPMSAWKQDPIAYMVREKLVLLMGNYGQSKTVANTGIQQKLVQAYNKSLRSMNVGTDGRLNVAYSTKVCNGGVEQVHGFFHITDLDFYRLPQNVYWAKVMIGDAKFSRIWDDQLGVIVPAAMMAPERAAEMDKVGIHPNVMHNGMIMGKVKWVGGGYKAYWSQEGREKFPEAFDICKSHIKEGTR